MKNFPGDPYCYAGSAVLRNLKEIRDEAALAAFEAAMVALHLARLVEEPLRGPFHLGRLLATHRRIFDGVYAWAGELRQNTGTMTKQRAAGRVVIYGDSAYIQHGLGEVLQKLRGEDFLRGLPSLRFAERCAFFYGEIDAIHPFREGNSRTLRQFFGDLAGAAGYRIEWAAASSSEEAREQLFLARDMAVMRGDSSLLAAFIAANLHAV